MRREGFIALGTLAGSAVLLWLVFWVAREWPDLPDCFSELSAAQARAVDAYRAGYRPLHLLAALALAAGVWRLAAARRGAARPGAPTIAALGAFLLVFALMVADDELAGPGFLLALLSVVAAPAAAALGLLALPLLAAPASARIGGHLALVAAWLALAVVLPGHFGAIAVVDESWCLAEMG